MTAAASGPGTTDLVVLAPLLLVGAGAAVVAILDRLLPAGPARRPLLAMAALAPLAAGLLASAYQYSPAFLEPGRHDLWPPLARGWVLRPFTVLATILVQALALLALLGAAASRATEPDRDGRTLALVLACAAAGILAVCGRDLMVVATGLAVLTLALLLLLALGPPPSAPRAALDLLVPWAFALGCTLLGAALLHAGRGTLVLPELGPVAREGLPAPEGLAALGGALLFAGLLFHAGVFPFRLALAPSLEAASPPALCLLPGATAAAGFPVLASAAPLLPREVLPALPVLALATVLYGAVGTLRAPGLRQALGYLAVAHAGLFMASFTSLATGEGMADTGVALRALLLQLAVFVPGLAGAAAAGAWIQETSGKDVSTGNLVGAAASHPGASACLSLCLLSLAGLPPTAGFWGRYHVVGAALQAGQHAMAAAVLLLAAVAAGAALRFAVLPWAHGDGSREAHRRRLGALAWLCMGLPAGAVLLLGVLPGLLVATLVLVRL